MTVGSQRDVLFAAKAEAEPLAPAEATAPAAHAAPAAPAAGAGPTPPPAPQVPSSGIGRVIPIVATDSMQVVRFESERLFKSSVL